MRYRVSAGILTTVLAVSLVIATLCASLISLGYYYRLATVQQTISDQLVTNAQSGINLLLAASEPSTFNHGEWLDLFGRGQDSVWLQQKPWGVHQLGIVRAQRGRHYDQQIALFGHQLSELGQSALYLSDEQRPLALAGNTQLKGNCYLPKAGVKSTYVNRVGYQGQQLVDGRTQESKPSLPSLSLATMDHLRQLTHPETYELLPALPDNVSHSFAQATLYYRSPTAITLSGTLRGNILIASDQAITISEQAVLEDIIVTAPQIIIAPSFTGRLQAIATDTLTVGHGGRLAYPSALVLLADAGGSIYLEENTRVDGTVLISGAEAHYHQRLLSVASGSQLTGMAYADGLVALRGSMLEQLSCRKFLLRTPSTLYENHILDGVIDPTRRSPHYLAAGLWGTTQRKGIAQWLY